MWVRLGIIEVIICMLLYGLSFAQELKQERFWERLDTNGYIRGEVYTPAWAKEESKTSLGCTVQLDSGLYFNNFLTGFIALRNRLYDINHDSTSDFDLREGYFNFQGGWFDIRAGQQIVSWGKADGINPTDNLCAKDRTIFSSETDDQRLGTVAGTADLYLGNFNLTGVWQPIFEESKLLGPFIPEKIEVPVDNPLMPSLCFSRDDIIILDPSVPARNISNSSLALKCSATLRHLDISASYFYGYSVRPDYIFCPPTKQINILTVKQKFSRIHAIGADFSLAADPLMIRGEGAYVITDFDKKKNPGLRQSYLHMVVGPEWECSGDLVFGAQYGIKYVPGFKSIEEVFENPQDMEDVFRREVAKLNRVFHRQDRRYNSLVTFRSSYYLFQKTLLLGINLVYHLEKDEYRLRPKIVYDLNDRLTVTAAADLFFGPDNTQFDMTGKYFNQIFLELKYSF